jgi:hypothetical protein
VSACPDVDLWPRLLDGDLPEREAHALRAHAAGCTRCTAELESSERLLSALSRPAAAAPQKVRALMQAIEQAAPPRRPALTLGLAAAAAVAVIAAVGALRPFSNDGAFTPRGATLGWRQKVRAEVRPLEHAAQPLKPGAALRGDAPLAVWYRNLEEDKPLYLLAWLVDGAGEVHWIVPTWPQGGDAPSSARLPRADVAALMPEAFVADEPQGGAGMLITVVSQRPLSAQAVEDTRPDNRSRAETLFPDALVWRAAVQLQ